MVCFQPPMSSFIIFVVLRTSVAIDISLASVASVLTAQRNKSPFLPQSSLKYPYIFSTSTDLDNTTTGPRLLLRVPRPRASPRLDIPRTVNCTLRKSSFLLRPHVLGPRACTCIKIARAGLALLDQVALLRLRCRIFGPGAGSRLDVAGAVDCAGDEGGFLFAADVLGPGAGTGI